MEKLCKLFQYISENVWDTISRNHSRGNYLFEEGITRDRIIGEIQNFIEDQEVSYIYAQKANNEQVNGGDLEIYLETSRDCYVRIFFQAKIIKENNKYPHLIHVNTNGFQWDLMKRFQKVSGCLPYYLLYNGIKNFKYEGTDCFGLFDEKQLGCTIAEIHDVKELCETNFANAKFDSIHLGEKVIGEPWRKIPCCFLGRKEFPDFRSYSVSEINIDKSFYPIFMDSKEKMKTSKFVIPEMPEVEKINDDLKRIGYKPAGRIILSKTEPRRK